MDEARIEPIGKSDDVRLKAIKAAIQSWKPRDEQSEESKRQFEKHLKKFMKMFEGNPENAFDEVDVTSTAVVVSGHGEVVRAYDMQPKWIKPFEPVSELEDMWEVVQRKVIRTPSMSDDGHLNWFPEVLDVEFLEDVNRIHIDVRFLLFADTEKTVPTDDWLHNEKFRPVEDDTFARALEVANALRDEALR